jgi:hypothetical protein
MGGAMSSIVVSGDTSGAITIAAPAVSGTNTLTLPASTGTVALTGAAVVSSQLPAGTVLQVVSTVYGTNVSTSSTSYVTTGLTTSITPKSATSKILVFCQLALDAQSNPSQGYLTIYRNSTDLFPNNKGFQLYASNGRLMGGYFIQNLDSPATTSSTTYTVYFRQTSASYTIAINQDSTNSVITLMEIAA